jgi:hypothetical protein
MEKTGFADWNCRLDNIIIAKNGKITFIDTEDRSFKNSRSSFPKKISFDEFAFAVKKLLRMLKKRDAITPDAETWLIEKLTLIDECLNDKDCKKNECIPIYHNSSLDPEEFDLEAIKQELYQQKQKRPRI